MKSQRVKGEEMMDIDFVDSVLRDLHQLNEDSRLPSVMKERILILIEELQFLVLYIFCFTKLNDSSFGKNKESGFAEISRIHATLEKKGLLEIGVLALDSGEFEDFLALDTFFSELLEKLQNCKLTMREDFFNFSDFLFQYDFSRNELLKVMWYITVSLVNILLSKGDMFPEKKVNIESLKEELQLFEEVFQFARENFKIHIQAWVCNAAGLCLLNWVLDEKEENTKTNVVLSDLQQKLNTALPEVTWICLGVLKASKISEDECLKDCQLVSKFVEFLLGDLKLDLPKDDIQMLRNGMIFLIAFLMDPPEAKKHANDGKLILTQVAAAVNDAVSLFASLHSGETKQGIAAERIIILIQDFLGKVNQIKAEVRKVYAHLFFDSSSLNCPSINILGLFDSIIENLKEIFIHFPKHPILTVQEEFMSLKNLLQASNLKGCFISEFKNEHKVLIDLWTQIVNLAYQAQRTVNSFNYVNSFWLDMLCLDDLIEEIKHIEAEVKRIQDQYMHDIDALNTETNSTPNVLLQDKVKNTNEVVVGFENEIKDILDRLISGPTELNIISIIGMAGMGKTTLANKVYSDSSIKYYFTKCAWCTISQSYNTKKLLLDILKDVTEVGDNFSKMEDEELADELRKCLKGQKYLIVMDDIWDVKAWNAIKLSFPDDNNASRIIFTTRIHNVVLEAKPNSCCYPLSPFSNDESWEMLEKKLFHRKDSCPPNFVEVGKQMAKDCKGLPLAVVLVAGLLKENIENLNWWKQIGESLGSRISKEGCVDIVELSYNHLPEHLKPCFLYFGSFQEDKVIRVQKLTRLWVAEGFIEKQEMKDLEILAKEKLMDLVGRSLVIVTKKSSCGGIKACRIHDILREFCLAKGEEENFFKLVKRNDVSRFSMDAINKDYRVCIQNEHCNSFVRWNFSTLHSLLFSLSSTYSKFPFECYFFTNSKFLHVLDLEDVTSPGEILEEVAALVLLRYLAIRCSSKPILSPIWRLQNLETISLTGLCEWPVDLSVSIWRMGKLRHIYVGHCLPPHLYDSIPPLENILSLSNPILTYGEKTERFLRKIPTVRKLKCIFLSTRSSMEDTKMLKLDILNHLESLNIWNMWERKEFCSISFSLPWTLRKLKLQNSILPWSEISIIAKLPKLEVLKLLWNAFSGEVWSVGDEEFLKLKFLKLEKLDIQQWNVSDESFPCLEQLLVECFDLEEIPSAFGHIPNLRMIQLHMCRSTLKRSAMKIQEEQIGLGNGEFEVLTSDIFSSNDKGWFFESSDDMDEAESSKGE